jgi:cation transporter-like permease
MHVVGADAATHAEVTVGYFAIDTQCVRQAIRSAEACTRVLLPVTSDRQGVLCKQVGIPGRSRVVTDLHDGIGADALLLGQGNNNRVVNTLIASIACAHVPILVELIREVVFLRTELDALVLHAVVGLGAQ